MDSTSLMPPPSLTPFGHTSLNMKSTQQRVRSGQLPPPARARPMRPRMPRPIRGVGGAADETSIFCRPSVLLIACMWAVLCCLCIVLLVWPLNEAPHVVARNRVADGVQSIIRHPSTRKAVRQLRDLVGSGGAAAARFFDLQQTAPLLEEHSVHTCEDTVKRLAGSLGQRQMHVDRVTRVSSRVGGTKPAWMLALDYEVGKRVLGASPALAHEWPLQLLTVPDEADDGKTCAIEWRRPSQLVAQHAALKGLQSDLRAYVDSLDVRMAEAIYEAAAPLRVGETPVVDNSVFERTVNDDQSINDDADGNSKERVSGSGGGVGGGAENRDNFVEDDENEEAEVPVESWPNEAVLSDNEENRVEPIQRDAAVPVVESNAAASSSQMPPPPPPPMVALRKSQSNEHLVVVEPQVPQNDGEQSDNTGLEALSTWPERRQAVVHAMKHQWNQYVKYAWGLDELQPVSKRGKNWFGLGLQILDSLTTQHLMGLKADFKKGRDWVAENLRFNGGMSASFFETNIRVVGGLLSAHALTDDAMFLKRAIELCDLMMKYQDAEYPHFPSGSFSLREPVFARQSRVGSANLAEIGTLQLEWLYLSVATRNATYGKWMMDIMQYIDECERPATWPAPGLVPTTVHSTGSRFNGGHISFGAGGDSYYEYLLKLWRMTGKRYPRLRRMYEEAADGARQRLIKRSGAANLTFIAEMSGGGGQASNRMGHLACFSAGMFATGADLIESQRPMLDLAKGIARTCYRMYKEAPLGLSPEEVAFNMGSFGDAFTPSTMYYILRPEAVESFFHLYRITGDVEWREYGWFVFQHIEKYARLDSGYSGFSNVWVKPGGTLPYDNTQQTFFAAETLKYLYLLFSDDHHQLLNLDHWVINTEAHPLPNVDPDDPIVKEVLAAFVDEKVPPRKVGVKG